MPDKEILKFKDVMTDKDGDLAKAYFIEGARFLEADGLRPDRIMMGLLNASLKVAEDKGVSITWLAEIRRFATVLLDGADDIILKMEEERRRSAN